MLAVFCLLIVTWASLRANAAWHFFAAQTIAEPLFENGGGPATSFAEAESRVTRALGLFPSHPDYLDFSARLSGLRSVQPGVMGRERRELLESAAENHRRALAVRPLWPYSWAGLLGVKDQLGKVDEEFRLALRRSVETGPWEPRVQLQVIRSGIRYWDELGSQERGLVRAKIGDGLTVQPREVFEVVRFYARPELICHAREIHVQIERWCKSVL